MIWAPVLTALLACCSYGASQPALIQPHTVIASTGQDTQLSCTINSGDKFDIYRVIWLQRSISKALRMVYHYRTGSTQGRGPGISERFSVTDDVSSRRWSLVIRTVQTEDDGDYYCTSWVDDKNGYIFGGGTQLTVLTGDVKAPSVSIFPPSVEEIATKKATVVCSLSDFTPRGATVKWLVDGKDQTDSVQSSGLSKQSDNLYMESSYLSLTADQWLRHETYSCKVSHQGKEIIQTLKRSECV
ncbi:immunoglobulin lambda-1 light chain isoform X6 [Xenopus laevis]|uniref:immunoglobulin lambda-1 light chain isoform X6 n=1 Tax=Xenopus laevis TaxID=8355 RepID=UPI001BB1D97B|nr:immunoglobulin lambda-1 light chain isoform X6 [Xenopus laevis]